MMCDVGGRGPAGEDVRSLPKPQPPSAWSKQSTQGLWVLGASVHGQRQWLECSCPVNSGLHKADCEALGLLANGGLQLHLHACDQALDLGLAVCGASASGMTGLELQLLAGLRVGLQFQHD